MPQARCGKQVLGFFVLYSVMLTTENKAGNLLPQNCPELEQFIKAQAHIRAAVHLIDELAGHELPQLPEKRRGYFRNLRSEVISMLWECDSNVQDLMSAFLIPLFPIETE